MADPNYGQDLELGPGGFQSSFPLAAGRRNLLLALYRRFTTDPQSEAGQAIYGGKCCDLRQYFAARLDPGKVAVITTLISRTALYDDRVSGCTATVDFDASAKKLIVAANVAPASGPAFAFVLAFTGVTAEILNGLS